MTDKTDNEDWTNEEMLATFANTPHERHSIMVGFARGLSEGSRMNVSEDYKNEEHYYALGWSIGEIIDRIMNNNPDDTRIALAQVAGIATKYIIIALLAVAGYKIL